MGWSDSALATSVHNNVTIAGVLRDIGLSTSPQHYRRFHIEVSRLGLDTSHFKGQAHLAGKPNPRKGTRPIEAYLVKDGPRITSDKLKHRLWREGLLEKKCGNPSCGIGPEWAGRPLVLQLDHINGEHLDNRLENLRILCPNCHTQTTTFNRGGAGRYRGGPEARCPGCGVGVSRLGRHCIPCATKLSGRKMELALWPDDPDLVIEVRNTSMSAVARRLGVSPNAVSKRMKKRGLNWW